MLYNVFYCFTADEELTSSNSNRSNNVSPGLIVGVVFVAIVMIIGILSIVLGIRFWKQKHRYKAVCYYNNNNNYAITTT